MTRTPDDDIIQEGLPNDATAAGHARRTVRVTLTRWQLPALVDSCVLAVSELVTNAVRHGRPPVGLLMRRRARDVCVEVHDEEPEPPATAARDQAPPMAESGRGLEIVRALADDVGTEQVPGDGKNVYASWQIEN